MGKLIRGLCLFGVVVAVLEAHGRPPREPVPKLYVTNSAGDTIHVIDLRTFRMVGTIPTGAHPHGAAVSGDGRRFFTTVESDHTLRVIDTATDKVLRSVRLSGL